MTLRFTITDQGNTSYVISTPSGWDGAQQGFDRDNQWWSLVEVFESTFQTYGSNGFDDGGRETIKNIVKTYGVDSRIKVLVENSVADDGNWAQVFSGMLPVALFIESLDNMAHLLQIVFTLNDFWTQFVANYNRQVDIRANQTITEQTQLLTGTATPTPFFNLPLPSQKIIKRYEGIIKYNKGLFLQDPTIVAPANYPLIQLDLDTDILSEIDTKYQYGIAGNSLLVPFASFLVKDSGDMDVNCNFSASLADIVFTGLPLTVDVRTFTTIGYLKFFIQKNDESPILMNSNDRLIPASFKRNDGTVININNRVVTDWSFTGSFNNLRKNDSIKIYATPLPALAGGSYMFFWGNQGWGNEDYNYTGAQGQETSPGLQGILQSAAYNPASYAYVDATSKLPTLTSLGFTIQAYDTFVVSGAFTLGSGGNTIDVEDGWVLQALVANPGTNLANWWISELSLYSGQQAYGNSFLNVTYNTTADDASTGLFQATGTNVYAISAPSINTYAKGLTIFAQFVNSNTLASTLQINALAVVPIINKSGFALVANDIISTLVAAGTNAYTLAAYAGLVDLVEGLILTVKFPNANTLASTLNVNALGAISILNKNGSAIAVGTIQAGAILTLTYDGTNFIITDTNGTITGQIYVLVYDGVNFILTPISNTNGITPTATKTAQAFLAHDVASGILDRITDTPNLFYSNYFGSKQTVKQYLQNGCGSPTALLKGLHVRGYTLAQKPYFSSFQDWFDGVNPIHNLGLGYDFIGGQPVIVCEPKSNFFNPTIVIKLNWVQNIKKSYDGDNQINQVQIGYDKWESVSTNGNGTPSGIDDPQSQRTLNSRFRWVGKLMTLFSKFVAASLTLEQTRRVGNIQTANYTYDNDTFIVALKNNGDGTFTPELNENFSSITNLTNPDTRYNSKLTPMRNFLRWVDFLSASLQDYIGSVFSFSSGNGNYDMTSEMTTVCPGDDSGDVVDEKGNIPVSNTPLFVAELLDIDHYIDRPTYAAFAANKNMAIGVSQTDSGHIPCFVKSCRFDITKGTFKLTVWPKVLFDIENIEVVPSEEETIGLRQYEIAYGPDYA